MLVDLASPAALDPVVSGAKAAWLSRALQAGLPVRPGVVVPAAVSREPLARAAAVIARAGSGRARLQLASEPLAPGLVRDLEAAAGRLGTRLVVRSSSLLEAGGEWAGAFTSYVDIGPADLPTAVRGCWASAFTVDALGRAAATGIAPGSVPMAILVQPYVAAEAGGVGRLEGDDVVVVGLRGAPVAVLQGWEPGHVARVDPRGLVRGGPAVDALGEGLLAAVGMLARAAHEQTGATAMEWASERGTLVVLQLSRPPAGPVPPDHAGPPGLGSPAAVELARLVTGAPGALGERLVLGWAAADPGAVLALGVAAPAAPARPDDVPALAREAIALADDLLVHAWRRPADDARAAAAAALAGLRGDDPAAALATLGALARPDPTAAARCLAAIARLRATLVAAGVATRPDEAWYVDPTELSPDAPSVAVRGVGGVGARVGTGRWEPFVASVAMAAGVTTDGLPAAPGVAGGVAAWIPDPRVADAFRPRAILVAPRPIPHLAPLLWDAAGIVTAGGGPGAHLFESARALGIPAVSGVDLVALDLGRSGASGPGVLAALDGWSGRVWTLGSAASRRPQSGSL